MEYNDLPLFLSNRDWFTHHEEYGFAIPTAYCPPLGIKEFNQIRANIIGWYEEGDIPKELDPYISIERFVEMRKSIDYTNEQIKKELSVIFSKSDIDNYNFK